ncbi:MAG: CapA family protein [Bacteroidota bacterium]
MKIYGRRYSYLLFITLLWLINGCKVSQKTTDKSANSTEDTVQTAIDTVFIETPKIYITQKGDTLYSLDEEVSIETYRVLPDSISLMAVGDIMMGTKFPNTSYLPANDGAYLWKDVCNLLSSADITFGNLEGTILDGEGEPKECKNPKACYLFKMPSYLAENLVTCGFDLISVANNHANDFGPTGRRSTQAVLDSLGIGKAGSIESPYTVHKINGIYVGFVAFAPNKGTLLIHNQERAIEIVKELDSLADIVVVSIHGGAEGTDNQHVTRKREFYFGEDRGNIYEFSHTLIDHGADIILGHGPHVARAIEVYQDRLIAYSLGNFLTYGRFNLRGAAGLTPILQANISVDGKFLSGQIHSFRQSYENGPLKDTSLSAANTIKKLTEEDFPENKIFIEEDGRIFYIQN